MFARVLYITSLLLKRRVSGTSKHRRVSVYRRRDGGGGCRDAVRVWRVGRERLSNFLLFVFRVGRWLDPAGSTRGGKSTGKRRRDIVLAIYIYESPAHTCTLTLKHTYTYAQYTLTLSCV